MNSKPIIGAEAVIRRKGTHLLKDRQPKKYRHPILDKKIRLLRTRQEARMLMRLEKLDFSSPKLINCADTCIEMENIAGKRLSQSLPQLDHEQVSSEIGRKVAFLHDHNIIHGDLTTSNMIFSTRVHFVDFGLSFISPRVEDKAVDLHLFEQALLSKHHDIAASCLRSFLRSYRRSCPDADLIFQRLDEVRQRGRYKTKI